MCAESSPARPLRNIISTWVTASPDHTWVFRHHVLPKLMLIGVVVPLVLHRASSTRSSAEARLSDGNRKGVPS